MHWWQNDLYWFYFNMVIFASVLIVGTIAGIVRLIRKRKP